MNRYGLGLIAATTAACTVFGIAACGDSIKDAGAPAATGGGANTGGSGNNGGANNGGSNPGGGASSHDDSCQGACCPTSGTCYSDATKTTTAPGAECLATRDNTGQQHIQMRQDWIRATTPPGNTDSIVYGVLAGRTEMPMKDCYQGRSSYGSGGYIQIIDFFLSGGTDITKDYSTVGYAVQVTDANLADTLKTGFCNGVDADYSAQIKAAKGPAKTSYELTTAQITPPDLAFPPGLPLPMGAADHPWKVGPTKAKRLDADFTVAEPWRTETLAKFADGGEYATAGYGGVFYYDEKTGYAHGYGQMGWTVVYGQGGTTHLSIPIREVETKSIFNDPTRPNCVGKFRTDTLTSTTVPPCGATGPKSPAWGEGQCPPSATPDHTCDPSKDEASATTDGYFLITELDQLYSPDLLKTLCVSYPNADTTGIKAAGFFDATTSSCRGANWDPTKPKNAGLPMGDWCAATNSKATADCHDAWKSHSLHAFSAANIKIGDATNPVATCDFVTGQPTP